jgi:hypothetical protein
MRGLDPRIHRIREKLLQRRMDCRVKPGNDGRITIHVSCPRLSRASMSYFFVRQRREWPGRKRVHARLRRAMPGNDGGRCEAERTLPAPIGMQPTGVRNSPPLFPVVFNNGFCNRSVFAAFERENSHHDDVVEWHHAARCAVV